MFESSTAELAWSALVLFLLLGLLAFLLQKSRSRNEDDSSRPHDLLTWSRETFARGTLSDDEYKTIKTKLGDELREPKFESKDGDQSG